MVIFARQYLHGISHRQFDEWMQIVRHLPSLIDFSRYEEPI